MQMLKQCSSCWIYINNVQCISLLCELLGDINLTVLVLIKGPASSCLSPTHTLGVLH